MSSTILGRLCGDFGTFFIDNKIEDEAIKKSVWLRSVGAQTYSLTRNLLGPIKPGEKSFGDIVTVQKEHFRGQSEGNVEGQVSMRGEG